MGDLVRIILNEATLEISKRGAITGEIYFQIMDTYFPGENWNDFVVIILTWWNKSVEILATSSIGTTANLSFMDGPFNIRGKRESDDRVKLTLVRRTSSTEEILDFIDVDYHVLRRSIREVSRRVLKIIKDKKWHMNEDIIELEKRVSL